MGLISRVSSRTYRFLDFSSSKMGIGRDSWHKRRKTGGRKPQMHKKRKFELGRPAANTKIAPKRVHTVRCMRGNLNSEPCDWTTVTSVGLVKESPEPLESLTSFTTLLPTSWSEPRPWSKVLSLPSTPTPSDHTMSPTTPRPLVERRTTSSLKKSPKLSTTLITADQPPKRSTPLGNKLLMSLLT